MPREGSAHEGGRLRHRAEQADQRRDVVDAEVHADARAGHAPDREEAEQHVVVAVDRGRKAGDLAEQALIDGAPGRLERGTEEGVRRAAQVQALPIGQRAQRLRGGEAVRDGLLGIDVLARLEGLSRDLLVRAHGRQIDDHFDLGVGQQLVDGTGKDAVALRLLPRFFDAPRGDGLDAQRVKLPRHVFEIDLADAAGADDADTYRILQG